MKLSRRHARWIYAVLAAAYVTGLAWIVLRYGVVGEEPREDAWGLAQAWFLRAHGAAAMLALATLGSLLALHVPAGWKLRQNLASGLWMLGLMGLLAVTGWLLYYAAGETLRAASSWAHMGVGIAAPLALVWHLAYAKRKARGAGRKPRRARIERAAPLAANVTPLWPASTTSEGRAPARR